MTLNKRGEKETARVAPLPPTADNSGAGAVDKAHAQPSPLPSSSSSTQRQTTIIDGKCYDITEFMKTHPGGSELLLLAVDRDSSVLFHSYHRRLAVARSALAGLPTLPLAAVAVPSPVFGRKDLTSPIPADLLPTPYTSTPKELLESPLYNEIREGVNAYFRSLPRGSDGKEASSRGGMLFKSAVLLLLTAAFYYAVVVRGWWLLTPFLGVLFAINGLAIQHDANHGAFSTSRTLNQLAGFMDDLIGGSGLMWRHQHVLAHHAYPNDMDWDADSFSNYPILRLNPALPARWWHRFQHIYILALYSLIGLDYSVMDVVNYVRGSYAHIALHRLRLVDHALFLLGKLAHFSVFLFVPLALWDDWRYAVFAIYLPLELCGGFFLAALFAVSHNTERCAYNLPKSSEEATAAAAGDSKDGKDSGNKPVHVPCWAEMQIRTSCNWSCSNPLWLWASGGLNFQIEHHLFPGVAHRHYPAIHPIVQRACAKRGIPYNAYPTFANIFMAHLHMVRKLGHDQVPNDHNKKVH